MRLSVHYPGPHCTVLKARLQPGPAATRALAAALCVHQRLGGRPGKVRSRLAGLPRPGSRCESLELLFAAIRQARTCLDRPVSKRPPG